MKEEEFEIDFKILKRKNDTLSKQNEYLKRIQEQVQKERVAEKKKLEEKNKVLNQMINQYEAYTSKLKKNLQDALAQNHQQKQMLDLFQEKTREYEQKIQEFQGTLSNMRLKKSQMQETQPSSTHRNKPPKEQNLKDIQQKQAIMAIKMMEAKK